ISMHVESTVSYYKKTEWIRGRKPGQAEFDSNHKFMQTIGEEMFNKLERISREKGIRVQTLLRAVIIPEWVQGQKLSRNPEGDPREIQTEYREKRNVRAREV